MSQILTRRSLVAAAPAAIVAATLPAVAGAPDVQLASLARKLAQANAVSEHADRRLSAVSAAYDRVMPPEPDAVFVRDDDDLDMKSWPADRRVPDGRRIYGMLEIERAEAALEILQEQALPGHDKPETRRKLARLREIVESHAAWRTERRATWLACGMEEAERAAEDAQSRCGEVIRQIARCPATTHAGIMLKARIAAHCFGDTLGEVEDRIDGVIDETATCGEGMALSILRDLARIADRDTAGEHHA